MSRTDKTAPWTVKTLYYPSWVRESHDHSGGRECDLPPRPTSDNVVWSTRIGACGWVPSAEFYSSGMARCGCQMCSRFAFEPDPSRLSRREARRYCRDGWINEY